MRHAWIDASAGIAGDMLLAALLDVGADLAAVRSAVAAVVGDEVTVDVRRVTRAGLHAVKVDVQVRVDDPPHRSWRVVRDLIDRADLAAGVRGDAQRVFARLAAAEGQVHDIDPEAVEFHEVGALDSIADTVGVCAALADLGIDQMSVGEIALGSGTVRAAHGTIPVPVPAVVQLARGWRVAAGGQGELTTPTGMALLATLATGQSDLPSVTLERVGVGAGTRDVPGRANVTRVLVGQLQSADQPDATMTVLEANVDDLDPRVWPGVLARLLAAGAADAWLTPILMKKGRPAHQVSVLTVAERAADLRDLLLLHTSTIGVRQSPVSRYALPRTWVPINLGGGTVRVKVSHRGGVVVQVSPEFDDVAAYAAAHDQPEHVVLQRAWAAAADRGWVPGGGVPERPDQPD